MRLLLIRLVAAVLITSCVATSSQPPDRLGQIATSVTIYRDAWGVPHIIGPTDASVVFGATYARAEDEFHYMEQAIIKLLGQTAAIAGPDWRDWDIFMRKLRIEQYSRQEYAVAAPEIRRLCDAFADGMNYFLATHPDVQPQRIAHFEPWHALVGYHLFHVSGIGAATLEQVGQAGVLDTFTAYLASSMWAIAGEKTASGYPMLFTNPHIPLDAPYEYSMHSDEGLNVSGQAAYGIGVLPISGHNAHAGWSITANEPDINDVYKERVSADKSTYRRAGEDRPVTTWVEYIDVLTDAGLQSETVTLQATDYGPMFSSPTHGPVSLRIAKIAHGGILEQFYGMAKATDLQTFKRAIAPMNLTYNNIAYAGNDGHIYYVYGGAIARRSTAFDWTQPVEGTDAATDWQGYHTLAELPQVLDPPSGYIQNSNSSPYTVSSEQTEADSPYPAYFFRLGDEPDTAIARRSRELLATQTALTLNQLERLAFDSYWPFALRNIETLKAEFDTFAAEDPDLAAQLAEPMELLGAWDGHVRVDSIAASIYMGYLFSESSDEEPRNLRRLENGLRMLQGAFGRWRIAYGDFNRLQRLEPLATEAARVDAPSLPTAGLPFWTGAIFTFNTEPSVATGLQYGHHGHSFVSVTEFTEKVSSRSIMAFGQSRAKNSPHYFDQAPLYARGEFKPAWFDRDEVRQNAVRAYHPGQ